VENWYDSMPRIKRAGKYDFRPSTNGGAGGGGIRIDSHFKSSHCVVCGLESSTGMSPYFISHPPESFLTFLIMCLASHDW
jgi:DNA polymerase zeta